MVIGFKPQFVKPIQRGDKVHTLREDPHNRWHAGKRMHMATGVRTSRYCCFKETDCTSTQLVAMTHTPKRLLEVWVDGKKLNEQTLATFIKNDGFAQRTDFINWFFTGKEDVVMRKLIHWTDLVY